MPIRHRHFCRRWLASLKEGGSLASSLNHQNHRHHRHYYRHVQPQLQQLRLLSANNNTTGSTARCGDVGGRGDAGTLVEIPPNDGGGYQSMGSFHSENLGTLMQLSNEQYEPPHLPFSCPNEMSTTTNNTNTSSGTSPRLSEMQVRSYRDDFAIDFDNWTFLNHGAFGAALRVGSNRAANWRLYAERQPLRFFDRDLLPHLAYATRCLANAMNAPPNTGNDTDSRTAHVTLLPNVTAGLNAVLSGHARVYAKDTHCILWDISYGSVKKMARHYYGNNVIEIPFLQQKYFHRLTQFDAEQAFLEALDDCLDDHHHTLQHKQICFILDHTTSNTALTLPIAQLAAHVKCRYRPHNVTVVVDGAHGLWAQDCNLTRLFCHDVRQTGEAATATTTSAGTRTGTGTGTGRDHGVDVYVTNGHKWLAAPRGVAVLAVADTDTRDSILRVPAVISHGVDEPDFLTRFVWDGCRDYAAALSIPAVCDYWKTIRMARQGEQQEQPQPQPQPQQLIGHSSNGHHDSFNNNLVGIRLYCKETLRAGIQIMADRWYGDGRCVDSADWPGLVTLADFDSPLLGPMALVRLPSLTRFLGKDNKHGELTSTDAKKLQDYLYHQNIEVPVKCVLGILYIRLSCHIYNRVEDYRHLAIVVEELSHYSTN